MSDSEKKRPVPVVERIRPIKRDNMMAVQSRTADLPAPFTPTRTLICSGNSNLSFGIPLNPSISMDSILIFLPANRQKNVEHGPEQRPSDVGAKGTLTTGRRGESIRTRTRAGARLRTRCHRTRCHRPRGARGGGAPRHSSTRTPRVRRCGRGGRRRPLPRWCPSRRRTPRNGPMPRVPKHGRPRGATCGASPFVIPPVRCRPRCPASAPGTAARLSRPVPLNIHPSNPIDMVAPVSRRSTHG